MSQFSEPIADPALSTWPGGAMVAIDVDLSGSSKCRTGCPTQDHESWGECARASNFSTLVGDPVHANRKLERNLQAYRDARRQGLQPQSIRRPFVEATKKAAGA